MSEVFGCGWVYVDVVCGYFVDGFDEFGGCIVFC